MRETPPARPRDGLTFDLPAVVALVLVGIVVLLAGLLSYAKRDEVPFDAVDSRGPVLAMSGLGQVGLAGEASCQQVFYRNDSSVRPRYSQIEIAAQGIRGPEQSPFTVFVRVTAADGQAQDGQARFRAGSFSEGQLADATQPSNPVSPDWVLAGCTATGVRPGG